MTEPLPSLDPGLNWAGNYRYKAGRLYQPPDIAGIREIVKRSDKVKALGSRHSFNEIADSPSVQISTAGLPRIIGIDSSSMTIAVDGGARYGDICPGLARKGYALHNLASLPHISVAGACATATHGSGVDNGTLSTAVAGLEFVSGTGEIVTLARDANKDIFAGAVVNLGALGIVTKITLDIQRKVPVRQDVFQDLAFDRLKDHFDEIMSSGYSVSLFTNWQGGLIDQVWIKRLVDESIKDLPANFFGTRPARENLHPIGGISAENCTGQMGIAGEWYERLPHFKTGFTPSSGDELQSEYFVPRQNAVDAIFAIEKQHDLIAPHLQVSEVRTIAADDLWLSPCYKAASVAIHFTWKKNIDAISRILPVIEAELAPYNARPHWGKLFATPPNVLRPFYDKLPDFIDLLRVYDPDGKFRNKYIDKYLFNGL